MNAQRLRMNSIGWTLLAGSLFCLPAGAEPLHAAPGSRSDAQAAFEAATANLPLAFEPDPNSKVQAFLTHGPGYRLQLTREAAVLMLAQPAAHETRLRMSFPGANPNTSVVGVEEMAMKTNYLVGEANQWHSGLANYARVVYRGIYRGVDLVYYGNQGQLEYDFEVAPGADPQGIRMGFPGAESLRVDATSGDLLISTAEHVQIRHRRPQVYQQLAGRKVMIEGSYRLVNRDTVAFSLASYDPSNALIIDPTVAFTAYALGNSASGVTAITVDSAGNSYITGYTDSTNSTFPSGTSDSSEVMPKKDTLCPGDADAIPCATAYFMKISPAGTIVYTTFVGGKDYDYPYAMATDATWAYIVGTTSSSKFTQGDGSTFQGGPLQINGQKYASKGYRNAFLAVLDLGTGQPQRYVLWGGTGKSEAYAVAADASQNAYVTGQTCASDFPTSALLGRTPYQKKLHGICAAFVTKVDANDSIAKGYSTYLSGSDYDSATGIVLDADGSVWVAGSTDSPDFPATNKSHAGNGTGTKAFVTQLSADGSHVLNSTILGAPGNSEAYGTAIAADGAGGAYVAGTVNIDSPSDNFYTTPNAAQANLPCKGQWLYCNSGFVTHVDADGNVASSTYLGGSANAANNTYGAAIYVTPAGIARNRSGDVYVGGSTTTSIGFPGAPAVNPINTAGFVTRLSSSLGAVVSTTFAGNWVNGIAVAEPLLATALNPTTTIYAAGTVAASPADEVFALKLVDAPASVSSAEIAARF